MRWRVFLIFWWHLFEISNKLKNSSYFLSRFGWKLIKKIFYRFLALTCLAKSAFHSRESSIEYLYVQSITNLIKSTLCIDSRNPSYSCFSHCVRKFKNPFSRRHLNHPLIFEYHPGQNIQTAELFCHKKVSIDLSVLLTVIFLAYLDGEREVISR